MDWFAPGYKAGGPIQSCVNLCRALNNDYDLYVLTTDTDHGETAPYEGIEPCKWLYNGELNVHINYLRKSTLSAAVIRRELVSADADVIYLNHLFSPLFVVYPLWLLYRKELGAKMVVCPRGALYQSALSLKYYKKKPLLALYKLLGIHKKVTFHATNSREEAAIQQFFPGSTVVVADNLPNLQPAPLKSIEKQTGSLKCIFIARIVAIKNLKFILQVLASVSSKLELTIVGPVEDAVYWNDCERIIARLPVNIRVNYIGARANNELTSLIQDHHLFVLPTTGENFGHSIFEALQAGRPVLISDQTPWQQLQQARAGWDLTLTDSSAFLQAIDSLANASQEEYDQYAAGARRYAANYLQQHGQQQQYHILFS